MRGPEEEEVNPSNYSGSGEKLKNKTFTCVENREQSYKILTEFYTP